MILFTSGYPCAGKSTLVKILEPQLEELGINTIVFDPKDYLPEDYDELSEEDRRNWNIASWEVCCEKTHEALGEYDNKSLIILDTAASKALQMRPLFARAQVKGHKVIYAFVHANLEERQSRTTEDLYQFESGYSDSFKITIPHLKRLADYFYTVKNPNDAEYIGLNKTAKFLIKTIQEAAVEA